MSAVIAHRAIEVVSRATDPKQAILDLVKPKLADIDVLYNMVLVATYIRPEKTQGGIIRPTVNVQEDIWQGKVGLVVKVGEQAFVDDDAIRFYGQKVNVGEWCVYRVGDAWSLNINDYPCRLIKDSAIKLKVRDPGVVF